MNNKRNPIVTFIIRAILYFMMMMIVTSIFLFIYVGMFYNAMADIPQQDEIMASIPENNRNTESDGVDVVTTNNSFVVVERNRNYKIYVDVETRNMYITPNVYPSEGYTMMYDGDNPKIYTGTINEETYEMFLNKQN